MLSNTKLSNRWFFLGLGVFAMLFSGVLYAWSILKIPFKEIFGWGDSALAFNFTITMCFFCISAFFSNSSCARLCCMVDFCWSVWATKAAN